MAGKEFDAVVAGHLCLDLTPRIEGEGGAGFTALFKPGKLIEVGEAAISTGGAVSNTGLALRKLGLKTVLMAKVNDDPLGRIILDLLGESGATGGMTIVRGEQTSYTVVISPPGIDRMFMHCVGCNDTFSASDIDYDVCARARLFHFGYPTVMRRFFADAGRELTAMFRRVREQGALTSLDTAFPDPSSDGGRADWDAILRRTLPHVDLFLPSVEEALFLLMRDRHDELAARALGADIIDEITGDDLAELSAKVISYGARIVVVKAGHRGCYLRTAPGADLAGMQDGFAPAAAFDAAAWGSRELWQPCYRAPRFASAAGAGDATIAGFLAAFLRGKTPAECLRYGCLLGWQCVQAYGTTSGIRTWEETEEQYRRGVETLPLEPLSTGWRYEKRDALWRGPNDRS
jgi:sugar/nucleoside kinase (ribokinase family)